MIEEAMTREESFSVMYTPFVTEVKADKKNKIKEVFAEKHPDYVGHIYTGNSKRCILFMCVCVFDIKSLSESGA